MQFLVNISHSTLNNRLSVESIIKRRRQISGCGGMADTLVLGTSASACGFESHYPDHRESFVIARMK